MSASLPPDSSPPARDLGYTGEELPSAQPAEPAGDPALSERARAPQPKRTRAGAAWVGISLAVLLLILLIVFIAQNTHKAKISFLWLNGSFPVGLALLVAAVAGALVAIVAGSTRILQLRQVVRARHSGARGRRRNR